MHTTIPVPTATTTTTTTTTATGVGETAAAVRPQRFATLVRVEIRKMTDTRSGKALLGGLIGLAVVLLAWKVSRAASGTGEVSFDNYTLAVVPSVSFLLPLLGLQAMAGEWTQRTALTTFTLSPRRGRVLGAKFLAALSLSAAVLAVVVLLTAGATRLGAGIAGEAAAFDGAGGVLRATLVAAILQVIMGAAFGALIPQTAVAMGVFIAAPSVWAAVAPNVLPRTSEWFDVFAAYDRLGTASPTADLPQTLVSVALWVVLPAAVGLAVSLRREVK